MKRTLLRFLALPVLTVFISTNVVAQDENMSYYIAEKPVKPKVLLGVGSGVYYYSGILGTGIEVPVMNKFSFFGMAGLGGWGYKCGFGVNYFFKEAPFKSSISVGYAYATGGSDLELEMSVEDYPDSQKIKMDLHGAGTFNLAYAYHFKVGKKSKISLNVGYAIPLVEKPYRVHDSQYQLDEVGETTLRIMQPGGLMLGCNFMIGI